MTVSESSSFHPLSNPLKKKKKTLKKIKTNSTEKKKENQLKLQRVYFSACFLKVLGFFCPKGSAQLRTIVSKISCRTTFFIGRVKLKCPSGIR